MTDEAKTYTQADIDELTAKHQEELNNLAGKLRAEFKAKEQKAKDDAKAEAERLAKEAQMTELEKANSRYAELEAKWKASEEQIALTTQKDETRAYLKELGVSESNLDYVFIPKDLEGTKVRAKAFKEMIDNVKKETFEKGAGTPPPNAGKDGGETDPFLQGFESGQFK